MPYIDRDYYENDFKGTMPQDTEELEKLIERASDVVDFVTSGTITQNTLNNSHIEKWIKKATASQVEYFINEGGYEKIFGGNSGVESAGVGGFNYKQAHSTKTDSQKLASPSTLEYLQLTGLLYGGIRS